jgi:hypothetical protein
MRNVHHLMTRPDPLEPAGPRGGWRSGSKLSSYYILWFAPLTTDGEFHLYYDI